MADSIDDQIIETPDGPMTFAQDGDRKSVV